MRGFWCALLPLLLPRLLDVPAKRLPIAALGLPGPKGPGWGAGTPLKSTAKIFPTSSAFFAPAAESWSRHLSERAAAVLPARRIQRREFPPAKQKKLAGESAVSRDPGANG